MITIFKKNTELYLFILSIIMGITALCAGIGKHSLWIDEAFSIRMASNSFYGLLALVSAQDPHPPLYYILLKTWCIIFDYSTTSCISFSILFGSLAGILGSYLFRLIFKKDIWIPAFLIMSSPFFIMFSRMIRYYSYTAFLITALLICLIKFLESDKKIWFVLLLTTHILTLYSDYPASTFFVGEFIAVLVLSKNYKGKLIKLILIYVITILVFMPWLQKLLYHIHQLSILPKADSLSGEKSGFALRILFTAYDFMFGECSFPWDYHIIIPLLILYMSAVLKFLFYIKKAEAQSKRLISILIISVSVSFLTVVLMANTLVSKQSFVYMPSRLMFCFIPFIIIIAGGISGFKKAKYFIVLAMAASNSLILTNYYQSKNFINPIYFIDWKGASRIIADKAANNDIIISDEPEVMSYYAKNYLKEKIYLDNEGNLKDYILSNKTSGHSAKTRIFLLLTQRDSTNYAYFSDKFINFLLSESSILFSKNYAGVSDKYFNVKKRLSGKAYKYKMTLYLLEIPAKKIEDFFSG